MFRMIRTLVLLVGMFCLFCGTVSNAAPKFSRGTALKGVIAYQDDSDPTQFWYIPTSVPLVMGSSLLDFGVKYWGVAKPFRVTQPDGFQRSIIGATLSGRANIDITPQLRAELIKELKTVYGVANPKLLPIPLRNVEVTPVLAKGTLRLTDTSSDVVFPKTIAFGSDFTYVVGSGDNRLFTQYVAAQGQGERVIADPSFAISGVGEAEFVGDPWIHHCSADLNEVWNKTRTMVNVSIGWGWFRLGSASYNNITQELIKSHIVKCDWEEGSLDTEKYGRQILELGKEIFQALNAKAGSGEGFFKFEPNPEPAEISSGQSSGWWPWTVSINGGYSAAHSVQSAHWESDIRYVGRFWWKVPFSMVLSVQCNGATDHLFIELGNSVPCITQDKADAVNARIDAEAAEKNKRLKKLYDKLLNGDITQEQFDRLYAVLGSLTLTEDLRVLSPTENKSLSQAMDSTREAPITVGLTDADWDAIEKKVLRETPRPSKSNLEKQTIPQRSSM